MPQLHFLFLFLKILATSCLRDVRMEAQNHTRLGSELFLRCSYDLEGETLYAVKWYRDGEEFYRFIPKELRPKRVFPLAGIAVDSDEHHVVLRNASFETSGKYKCVVSVENSFETVKSGGKSVQVVVFKPATLRLLELPYHPGDRGEATCQVSNTHPPVNISWYIQSGGGPVKVPPAKIITRVETNDTDPRLTSSISVMYFQLPINYNGVTVIKCRVDLFDYSEAKIVQVEPIVKKTKSSTTRE